MNLNKVTYEIFSKLEQQWLYHNDGKKTRVLSIDGGGTTCAVAGAALIHLEDQIKAKTGDSNARIVDFFDIVAGTGIGAVLAVMINADDGNGRPIFSAREAVNFVTDNQTELFKAKRGGILRLRKRFSGESMERVLREILKERTLRETCKPMLVPCYDLKSSAPFVFSRADAAESESFNFELWKVCRATSATPSLFKPFKLTSVDGRMIFAIDGGLVMNSPASAAVTHILHNKRDFPSIHGVEDLLLLSLGNGQLTNTDTVKLGCKGYCSESLAVDIVLDGVSDTVDQMMVNAFSLNRMDYVRVQANGVNNHVLEEHGVESLPFGGKRLLTETNGQRIEAFVQRLVASGRSSLPPSPCKDNVVSPILIER